MKALSLVLLLVLSLSACGGKDKVKNENTAAPGRDKELYDQASTKTKKGRYDEARLLYNVVITTYPDSTYLPLAKLSIADSFYLEGGTSNLEQAIGGYKDFAQYFPTHPMVCNVRHKIAHALMRQMGAYNRDASKAKQAEFQLKAAEQSCRNSPILPDIQHDLADVQQVLGLHELDVARFYFNTRQAYKASENRLRGIIDQYPFFSYYDESLYLLGVSLIEQEQPEEATTYFTKLVRDYPNSEFATKGKDYLEKLGKPIPEPSNNNPAPQRPGYMGKFGLILGRNGLDISKDGVLLSREAEEKEDVKDASVKPADAANQTGTRAVRASTKGPVAVPPSDAAAPKSNAVAPATAPTATPAAEQKPGEAPKEEKKKKKGLFGRVFK